MSLQFRKMHKHLQQPLSWVTIGIPGSDSVHNLIDEKKKKMVRGVVFHISIAVLQFCSQSHGPASLFLAFSGHAADEPPKTAGPLIKNATRMFSIRITSLINSWQAEHTRAGITGKMMIYLFPNCRQLWILPQKANKKPKKIFDDFVFFYDNQHHLWPIM